MITYDFSSKTAVITGGGGIICGAFAKELAQYGAKVALLDLNLEAAETTASEINATGGKAMAVRCDVLDKQSVEAAEEAVCRNWGGYNLLINGAGGNHPKANTTSEYYRSEDVSDPSAVSFFDLSLDGFQFVFQLNIMGTFIVTQVFAKKLIEQEGASIINIASMGAPCPLTKVPAYSAAKAAVVNLTEWLAVHFADTGLRVNAIAPGFFVTNQNRDLLINTDGSLTARSDKIISHTPLRRFGEVENLFGALFWLCDEKASGFVTGITVPVDGGFMAYSGV